MTNQSREAFLADLAKKMGDAGYCNYDACKEYLEAALSEGRRHGLEEFAVRWDNCANGFYEGQYIASEARALIDTRSKDDGEMGPVQAEKAGDAL